MASVRLGLVNRRGCRRASTNRAAHDWSVHHQALPRRGHFRSVPTARRGCMAWMLLALLGSIGCAGRPSDREMINVFASRSVDFRRLADTIVSAGEVQNGEQLDSEARRLGIHHLRVSDRRPIRMVQFELASGGTVFAGYHKGIAYSTEAVEPVFDTLDSARFTLRTLAFRSIEDNWYVYEYRW